MTLGKVPFGALVRFLKVAIGDRIFASYLLSRLNCTFTVPVVLSLTVFTPVKSILTDSNVLEKALQRSGTPTEIFFPTLVTRSAISLNHSA